MELRRKKEETQALLAALADTIAARESQQGRGTAGRMEFIVGAVAVGGPNAGDFAAREDNPVSGSLRGANQEAAITFHGSGSGRPNSSSDEEIAAVNSMIEATLVADDLEPQELVQAQPLKRQTFKWCLLFIGGVLVLITAIVVAVVVSRDNESVVEEKIVPFSIDLLPNITRMVLNETDSAQSKALEWVMNDPKLHGYNASRVIQRFALATFYYATNGDYWDENTDWLSYEIHECSWFTSIDYDTCSSEVSGDDDDSEDDDGIEAYDRPMTSLTILYNNVSGFLPPEIGLLSHLTYFDVAPSPLLGGTIPTEIGLWTDMTYFYMSKSQVTGSIPTEVGKWTHVLEFSLSRTAITGNLPTELGLMRDCQYLWLPRNTGLSPGPIPSELGQLVDLFGLDLTSSSLTGMAVPSEFGNLYRLAMLRLGNNALTSILPDAQAGNLSSGSLAVLHIQGNQIVWDELNGSPMIPKWVSSVEEHFL